MGLGQLDFALLECRNEEENQAGCGCVDWLKTRQTWQVSRQNAGKDEFHESLINLDQV